MDIVSVIITTYHREFKVIRRAIESALAQQYQELEIVLVDDNENNSAFSLQIIDGMKEFANKVTYLSYDGNKGACFARNYGVRNTNGKYLAFLDDDDVWHPDKITRQIRLMEEKQYVLVSCNSTFVFLDRNGNEDRRIENIRSNDTEISLQNLLIDNIPGGCSFPLVLREAFVKAGEFRVGLPSSQDYDLWIRIAQIGKIGHVSESLLDYYVYQSERISKNVAGKIAGYELLIDQYAYLADNKKEYIARKYKALGNFCFEHDHFKEGVKYTRKAVLAKISVYNCWRGIQSIIYGAVRIMRHKIIK